MADELKPCPFCGHAPQPFPNLLDVSDIETDLPETVPCWTIFRGHDGMTLRDWFAGQALAGMLANAEEHFRGDGKNEQAIAEWHRQVESGWAVFCYRMADAMLAERQAKKKETSEATND